MTYDFPVVFSAQEQTLSPAMETTTVTIDPCLCEYVGNRTSLKPATSDTLGGIMVGNGLKITDTGLLSVDTADQVEQDNTKPITSAAVYTEVGNINALLATI